MTTHNFNNDATQSERKAIVKNDSYITRERNTYLSHTDPDDDLGGRFKRETPSAIIAKNPASAYPRLPSSSPWGCPDPLGIEAPLNIDVNDLGFHAAPSTTNSGEAPVAPPLAAISPTFLKRRV